MENKDAAKKFREYWIFRPGSEKGEDQQFWNSLLRDVLGLEDIESAIKYQLPVKLKATTKFLDAWIPSTRVLIEHKTRGVKLDAPQAGHGGMTPYEQAKEYDDARALYPDSSLADLYDPLTMPIELRKAHAANDRAVLAAYGLAPDTPEPEIVAHLFSLYSRMTKQNSRV